MDNLITITEGTQHTLNINNEKEKHSHFHIQKVEVFTGGDDYVEKECFCLSVSPTEGLCVHNRVFPTLTKTKTRLRNEPGVRIFIKSEENWTNFVIHVGHHKGEVVVEVENLGDG